MSMPMLNLSESHVEGASFDSLGWMIPRSDQHLWSEWDQKGYSTTLVPYHMLGHRSNRVWTAVLVLRTACPKHRDNYSVVRRS